MKLTHALASLAAGALATTGLALGTPTAAHADTPTNSTSYSCSSNLLSNVPVLGGLLGGLTGSLTFPLDLSVLDQVTVPVGGVLEQVTDPLGLTPVIQQLGGTVEDLLGTVSGVVLQISDNGNLVGSVTATLTGSGLAIPSLPLPGGVGAGDLLSLIAPSNLSFNPLGGLLGTVSCVLDQADQHVVASVLVGDAGTPNTSGTAKVGGKTVTPVTRTSSAKPVVLAALAKKRIAHTKKDKVGTLVVAGGKPVRGFVAFVVDGHKKATKRLSARGTATYTLKGLTKGTHRVSVRLLKAAGTPTAVSKKLTLKVK